MLVVIGVLVGAGLIYAATDQSSASDCQKNGGTWDVVGTNQFGDNTYGCTYP